MPRTALVAAIVCALTVSGCSRGDELECPVPQLQSNSSDIKETANDIQAYQDRFAGGFSENAISDAIASLRIKHPDASNDEIVNFLVAAYCPNARGRTVGASAQKAKLAAFETAVHAVLGD